MAMFEAKSDGTNPPVMFSCKQAEAMFNKITNAIDSDFLVSPKVVQPFGQEGKVFVGSVESIAGNQQLLGLQICFFPSVSADSSTLDVDMLIRYTVATAAVNAPVESP
jgi:hypothetical protein